MTVQAIQILNTGMDDLPQIYQFFEESVRYQEQRGYPSWRNYDKEALARDVANNNQYKVVVEGKPAIVFSVCYADPIIWRDRERGDAMYLHRIVVNPEFKGRQMFREVVGWSKKHCEEKDLKKVRMDTWAANRNIVDYYRQFDFMVVENFTTPDTPELPLHNRNLDLTLLELQLGSSDASGE